MYNTYLYVNIPYKYLFLYPKIFTICSDKKFHKLVYMRSSEKFLSFHKEIMDAHFLFYIILSNYASIWFSQNKDYNVRQIKFHVCIKINRCKKRVCKRKTLFERSNNMYLVCISKTSITNVDLIF